MTSQLLGLDDLLRIDVDAQLHKLATCQLEDDLDLVVELLRAAVIAGAQHLSVTMHKGLLSLSTPGPLLSDETWHALRIAANPNANSHERQRAIELVERNAGAGWLALLGRKDLISHARSSPNKDSPWLHLPNLRGAPTGAERTRSQQPGGVLLVQGLRVHKRSLRQGIAQRLTPFGPRVEVCDVGLGSRWTGRQLVPLHAPLGLHGVTPALEGCVARSDDIYGQPARVCLSHGGFTRARVSLESLQGFELVLNLDPLGPAIPTLDALRRAIQNSTFGIEERLAQAVTQWATDATDTQLLSLRGLVTTALTHRKESPIRHVEVFESVDASGLHRSSWESLVSSTGDGSFTYIEPDARARLLQQPLSRDDPRVWIADPETLALVQDEPSLHIRTFPGARSRGGLGGLAAILRERFGRLQATFRGRPLSHSSLSPWEATGLARLNAAIDPRRARGRRVELSAHRGAPRCTSDYWLLSQRDPLTREMLAAVHSNRDAAYLAVLALGHQDAVPDIHATDQFDHMVSQMIRSRTHEGDTGASVALTTPARGGREERAR